MIKGVLKRYSFFLCTFAAVLVITVFNRNIGAKTFSEACSSFLQMLTVLPPIMILLGLMDVWIPRERMMRYMGSGSGILGIGLAFVMGTIGAGPMYAAFPFTAVLLKKGVKFSNIIIFMNAWCVTKITTMMFEIGALGYEFSLIRLMVNIPGVILMGYLVEWLMRKSELNKIYENNNIWI